MALPDKTTASPKEIHDRSSVPLDAASMVELYGDLVFHFALRLTGDREEARDLAQDAFVRILEGAGTFRGEASPRTWICQVVINCHRNRGRWWRRLKRGRTVSLEETTAGAGPDSQDGQTLGSTLADPQSGPDEIVAAEQTRTRLEREIQRLPLDQRTALILREVEEMTYSQIAAAMGVREGTVKSRLARARETLRLALRKGPS